MKKMKKWKIEVELWDKSGLSITDEDIKDWFQCKFVGMEYVSRHYQKFKNLKVKRTQ